MPTESKCLIFNSFDYALVRQILLSSADVCFNRCTHSFFYGKLFCLESQSSDWRTFNMV